MDIVERLRKVFGVVVKADDCFEEDYTVARKAADEIERLRQQVAELAELMQATVDYTGAVVGTNNYYFAPKPKATGGE